MPFDDSTISDLRALLEIDRADIAGLDERLTLLEKDVDRLEKSTGRHICEPHVRQEELATLRVILRAVSDRLARLESTPPTPEGSGHATR